MDSSVRAVVWQQIRPGAIAAGQGLAVALLCLTTNVALFVLSVVSLALIPVFGIGFALFPVVTVLVRWSLTLQRRLSRWSRAPIASPYAPVPAGAQLGTWKRFRWVVGDPATWRDFAWLIPGALTGAACLLAFVLPFYGLEGVLFVPLVLYLTLDWWGYGLFWPMDNLGQAMLAAPQGWLILAGGLAVAQWLLWLHFRFAGFFLAPTRAQELALRVQHLTATRADTIDTQAAELRRIERDLHDGAQARLVALRMSIGLAEKLLADDPAAAQRLLSEAQEASGHALAELRDLVRGIYPPVLAERGLDGAVQALALAVPLPVEVEVELPGSPPAAVESAAYFAVAEALTNVTKHSGAGRAWIRLTFEDGLLTMVVGDDGCGSAAMDAGTGLAGVRRRLAAFDGTMTVTSPPGGPTVVTMELPCELSSPRTSPSSGTG
ncbi:Signal transduction histidine kinase [Micromonospora viridifaciens]|uniref:histidine kinase n=1 Tax=Micromonospora viridifaciens TaxID=1881 RepID=A0A1C4ZP08_MICVI|nr:histidine kinase [Micromonospora viridifaciens]SCF34790.1 Signal transduction histidine kinase [Micromonospora viridifaciens]